MDRKDDEGVLSEMEKVRRSEVLAKLFRQHYIRKSLLAQKAKFRWLKEGDVNSKLFHRAINYRRRKNGINGIEVDGEWVEEPARVKEEIRLFFENHFQGRRGERARLEENFEVPNLDREDGEALTRPFTEEEVRNALWGCDGSKSPGPDGFNMGFFKEFWGMIKEDVLRMMLEFHTYGRLVKGANSSFIVLIPKKQGAGGIDQFRPVSLIGSAYKLVAKVLARRLRGVMGKLIGDTQSTFLKGRNILDGAVILNEVMEEARKSKKGRMIFKVDFAKAYDSIEWDYLLDLLGRMNFPIKWIRWVRECVTTASANVLVNGSPLGEFSLGRSIRQGDPLSPFLFLIAAEGLNLLTRRAVKEGLLKAVEVGRDRVEITHTQYADDTVFVVDENLGNVSSIIWLLKSFELVSCLSVNFEKSSVFGLNLQPCIVESIAGVLGCRVGIGSIPYLGLNIGGRVKGKDAWSEVVDKMLKKLKGWESRLVSMGGRATLVKSTLSAIPIYWLSFFPIPKGVEEKIRSLQCKYFWGGNESTKKIAWLSWDDICKSKREGGLGMKLLNVFNRALLSKWVWRFLVEDNRLWVKVIRSRHGNIVRKFEDV